MLSQQENGVKLCHCLQEQVHSALPSPVTDTVEGEPGQMKTTVIELPASMVQTLHTMVTGNLPQCKIDSVLVQNGLTTNQVRF